MIPEVAVRQALPAQHTHGVSTHHGVYAHQWLVSTDMHVCWNQNPDCTVLRLCSKQHTLRKPVNGTRLSAKWQWLMSMPVSPMPTMMFCPCMHAQVLKACCAQPRMSIRSLCSCDGWLAPHTDACVHVCATWARRQHLHKPALHAQIICVQLLAVIAARTQISTAEACRGEAEPCS